MLKILVNNEFKGFWSVGTAAVVIAETKEKASKYLNKELKKIGLPGCKPDQFKEVELVDKNVLILNDGEY